ncbi:MAG TPA: vitamin K epoxide reductase family protein [Patescibacteria group bacterium]|nr:vitamin K epoxide reductase family protein [Patescibacteria group bacterium]
MKQPKTPQSKLDKVLPYLFIVMSIVGLFASFIIMTDKIKLLENPNYIPPCSLNPVLSCGPVMKSKQAATFGFPNPFVGLAAFGSLLTIGMAMLAGAKFKRWFWLGLEAGTIFGIGFVHYLFFQSVYRIKALCIYCMMVWAATIILFVYVTLYNLRHGHISTPKKLEKPVAFLQRHHVDLIVLWLLIITGLILNHFWYYFGPRI